jgi:hypothetical protein
MGKEGDEFNTEQSRRLLSLNSHYKDLSFKAGNHPRIFSYK